MNSDKTGDVIMARKKDLNNSITEAIILRLLSERSMYGYEIIKLVNDKTNGEFRWQEGTLYPCLHTLEERGLICGGWRTDGKKPRKYYVLTKAGAAATVKQTSEVSNYLDCVHALLFGAI